MYYRSLGDLWNCVIGWKALDSRGSNYILKMDKCPYLQSGSYSGNMKIHKWICGSFYLQIKPPSDHVSTKQLNEGID